MFSFDSGDEMSLKKFIGVVLLAMATGGAARRQISSIVQGGGSGGTGYVGGSTGTDTIVIMGDSVSAAAFNGTFHPDLTECIDNLDPGRVLNYVNDAINGGSAGALAPLGGLFIINGFLAANPGARYFALAYGKNDMNLVSESSFRSSMQTLIDRLIATGRVPVIPTIPFSLNPVHAPYQAAFNAITRSIVLGNNLPPGPDLYAWFFAHQDELGPDGSHPNANGSRSINLLWAKAMLLILRGP
jgi:acyl-CoA thioesterase-1